MYGTFDVVYQDIAGSTVQAYAIKRPNIPAPQKSMRRVYIPRRGDLYVDNQHYEDISFDVEFNFHGSDLGTLFRSFKEWLLKDGNRQLTFTDDNTVFYKVKRIEFKTAERVAWQIKRQTVRFTCDPYTYLASGLISRSGGTFSNPTWCESKPIYTITGSGQKTLTVNGKTFTANVSTKMIIDVEREIAIGNNGQNQSDLVSGNYSDLILKSGSNTVSLNSGTLAIQPNWRAL